MSKSGAVELALWIYNVPKELKPFRYRTGYIEGTVGDEVIVRFGETVIQIDPELLVQVEETPGRPRR